MRPPGQEELRKIRGISSNVDKFVNELMHLEDQRVAEATQVVWKQFQSHLTKTEDDMATATKTITGVEFSVFSKAVSKRFKELGEHKLFVVGITKEEIWKAYLRAFPEGTNPIYKTNTEHDCSTCRNFIGNLGRVVAIIDGKVETVWSGFDIGYPYNEVAQALNDLVLSRPISSAFLTKEQSFGAELTLANDEDGKIKQWNHFHGEINRQHVNRDVATQRGLIAATAGVLERGLCELKVEHLDEILDLIEQNTLYRGQEFKANVVAFKKLLQEASKCGDAGELNTFVWANVYDRNARFRNTVIGTLATDLAEGADLERAVRSFEAKVAPTNYKRPKALITPRMVEDAMKTLREEDLEGAVKRRFAKVDDVSVNNVLFVDNSLASKMRDFHGIESVLMDAAVKQAPNLDNATPISADDFVEKVLPNTVSIEALVENTMLGNFMSLTAPVEEDSGRLLKWGNDFAWSYDGEVADSVVQRVKKAGGRTDTKFRVSLGWFNYDDLDIHMLTPDGRHIYYGEKAGILDVDMNAGGRQSRDAVENLQWDAYRKDGWFKVFVHNFCRRESSDVGFEIDADLDGQRYVLNYPAPVTDDVVVMEFHIKRNKVTEVKLGDSMQVGCNGQEKWGVKTGEMTKVNTLLWSPNHWDDNATGNKHLFFILDKCLNPDSVRGIYNEFLHPSMEKHRKVFEVLGSKMRCPASDEQLSGIGFSSTKKAEVKVITQQRVGGKRAYAIQFGT